MVSASAICTPQDYHKPQVSGVASGVPGTWTEWRCLNRLCMKMGCCKHNLRKWKYTDEDDTTCDCKEADQTMEHLLKCPLLRQTCSLDDLMGYNDVAKECVRQWIGLCSDTTRRRPLPGVCGFIICSGLCACTEMLWMSVLYASFGFR